MRDQLILSRREVLESLSRQGITGLSRIKGECRRFERHWQRRLAGDHEHGHHAIGRIFHHHIR